jgi:hypothetical protein
LTEKEREAITAYFTFCDSDADGFITVRELREALAINMSGGAVLDEGDAVPLLAGERDFATFFEEADLDDDGRLSVEEVLHYHSQRKRRDSSKLRLRVSTGGASRALCARARGSEIHRVKPPKRGNSNML